MNFGWTMDLELKRGTIAVAGPHTRWDYEGILANACALQKLPAASAAARTLLSGKHLAILARPGNSADARLFLAAATGLGAQVAEIRAELWAALRQEEIKRMAGLLGCLYVAVECQDEFDALAPLIAAGTGIAIYDYIASPGHPTAKVVALLKGDEPPCEKRLLVLQGVLLATIA